ncbi:hypothetical protein HS088_TW06G00232 [Tripterygium wilfordii]|uniref:GPI-anchored protein n=1 Tax=Tripterygium wilfordii TaxID=458696 RepID=A0A7J7DI94_TRIWF|nr:hypothetical protein HS088_TW06G00232 [Tripterygium wilfordii]
MSKSAVDCYDFFNPFLNNAVCCPQFRATLDILMGQSSKNTGSLVLDQEQAMICLFEVNQILYNRGTDEDVGSYCSIPPTYLAEGSCPVTHVSEFESIVNSTRLLDACRKIDPVNECCKQDCQRAILRAAIEIALKSSSASHGVRLSTKIKDCKNIVRRWLASKLDPSSANGVLRALTSCEINKVCPLDFPEVTDVSKECGGVISNSTSCCTAMEFYMTYLQEQTLLTDLQSVNCAISLGKKLRKANVTQNVYSLCNIKLMDFTAQGYSGCLLPRVPVDAIYNNPSGLGVSCNINGDVEAPWRSNSSMPYSYCYKSI